MNDCLSTRRALFAAPQQILPETARHLSECATCRGFAARLEQNEYALQLALAIPVPDQLAESILLRTQMHGRTKRKSNWLKNFLTRFRPFSPQLLGSLSLVILLFFLSPLFRVEHGANWNEVILAHAINEEAGLEKSDDLSTSKLEKALDDYHLGISKKIGKLRYIGHCALPGGRGLHALIDTPEFGSVSLILPPAGTSASTDISEREGYFSQIVRINNTSVGFVSRDRTQLETLKRRIQETIVAKL